MKVSPLCLLITPVFSRLHKPAARITIVASRFHSIAAWRTRRAELYVIFATRGADSANDKRITAAGN